MSRVPTINGVSLDDFSLEDVREYVSAFDDDRNDPRDLVAGVPFLDRQWWFDRLKLEAARLGVVV